MPDPIALVRPQPNAEVIKALEILLAEARSGMIEGIAGVKLRRDNRFVTIRFGECSDLELAGALAFAQHDLIKANPVT